MPGMSWCQRCKGWRVFDHFRCLRCGSVHAVDGFRSQSPYWAGIADKLDAALNKDTEEEQ